MYLVHMYLLYCYTQVVDTRSGMHVPGAYVPGAYVPTLLLYTGGGTGYYLRVRVVCGALRYSQCSTILSTRHWTAREVQVPPL